MDVVLPMQPIDHQTIHPIENGDVSNTVVKLVVEQKARRMQDPSATVHA